MKFLGEHGFEVATAWKEKLEDEEIYLVVDEVGGYFGASWATMGTKKPRLRLFSKESA